MLNLPLIRGFSQTTTRYHVGSVIENRFGLQVYRTLGKQLSWKLRRERITSKAAQVLDRDGVLEISDFLSQEKFKVVKEEVDRLASNLHFKPFRDVENGRLYLARTQANTDAIRACLGDNKIILDLAGAVTRRPISAPTLNLISYRVMNPEGVDNDLENILHADLHTSTAKCFYFPEAVEDGPFVYAKGTHELSLARLQYEYDMSVRSARLRRGDDLPQLAERGPDKRNVITAAQRRAMGVVETPFFVKANTLVVANTMGLHRRGYFTGDKPRVMIQINFRHLEKPF